MKMIVSPRMKAIMVLCAMAACVLGASASTIESMPSTQNLTKGKDSPFVIFCNVWKNIHKDDKTTLTLLTKVPSDTLKLMAPQLKKDFKVDKDVIFDLPYYYVGEVITTYTQLQCEGKTDEKNAFRAIQYSISIDDLDAYLEKYPEATYCKEIKARRACFNEYELWVEAQEKKTRPAYEAFADACSNTLCEYEGCEAISAANHKNAEAVRAWYALLDKSEGSDPKIYKDFENYIQKYGDYPEFAKEARKQMGLYKDRYDWDVASRLGTTKAIQGYLDNHADGQYAKLANSMLVEVALWEQANRTHSYKDYCDYYTAYPDGKYAKEAEKMLKQHENTSWQETKAAKTLDAYEKFVKQYPNGYYKNEALNSIAKTKMLQNKKTKPSFTEFNRVGDYSHPGYSLICFGNADNTKRVFTIYMTGPAGYSETISARDEFKWVMVKDGKYEVLIQGMKDEIIRGSVTVENGIYYRVSFIGDSPNKETTEKMKKAIEERVKEEALFIESAKK